MSDDLSPRYNLLAVRAALRLIYEDIQDQVQKLKSDVEGCSWYSSRDLADLGKKGILLSSKSKKIMDGIFSPGFQDGRVTVAAKDCRVRVAAYLGTQQLQECKKPWDSIHRQLDGIRVSLNAKLRSLNSYLVWIPLCYAFVLLPANLIATIRLSSHKETSFVTPHLVLFVSIVCFLFIYLHFFVARFATRLVWF